MKKQNETQNNKEITKPFGTLYHFQMDKNHGSVVITKRKLNKKASFTRTVGAGLTSAAMALYIYSFGPITQSQVALENKLSDSSNVVLAKAPVESPKPKDTSFSIYIPFLRSKSEVVINTDPFNEEEYTRVLNKGVAQAKGTGLPGEGKRIFMFAHSTNSILNIQKYNAIFYELGKVPNGELIELYYHEKVYQYRVFDQKIVGASEVSWLESKDGEELILQTCYPPGTNWKRLLLFATPV